MYKRQVFIRVVPADDCYRVWSRRNRVGQRPDFCFEAGRSLCSQLSGRCAVVVTACTLCLYGRCPLTIATAQDCILWHLLPHLVTAKSGRTTTRFLPWCGEIALFPTFRSLRRRGDGLRPAVGWLWGNMALKMILPNENLNNKAIVRKCDRF